MNERILKLFTQACYHGDYEPENVPSEVVEKFAELIVRECCDMVNKHHQYNNPNDCLLVLDIKEHFGVGRKQEIIEFFGVPLVRVAYVDSLWQVQMRDSEDSQNWFNVGNGFQTSDEAVDAAPELCEF